MDGLADAVADRRAMTTRIRKENRPRVPKENEVSRDKTITPKEYSYIEISGNFVTKLYFSLSLNSLSTINLQLSV